MFIKLIVVCASLAVVSSLNNGLALTPPMGFEIWERFRCNLDCENDPDFCIREQLFMQMADVMVSEGYKELGYEYVILDDCWPSKERDSQGRLQPDPDRFPSGMAALAKYVHSKGLKLGIYEDFGTETCGKYPGSEFYLSVDAQTFADWGIDYVKLDVCNSFAADAQYGYPIMEFFMNRTGRPMVFSCEWPLAENPPNLTAIRNTCNLWRTSQDMDDSWDVVARVIEFYGKDTNNLSAFAGPGGWNDPDQLLLGDFGLSYDQERVQIGMYAMWASPLLMSVDLRDIRPKSKALLQNRNLIRINQDPMGVQAKRLFIDGYIEVWTRPIVPKGSLAIALHNPITGGTPRRANFDISRIGLVAPNGYNLTEVFDGTAMGTIKPGQNITSKVNPTGIVMFTATPL